MLFDLRGRGRRRTVQVIYLGLALLMGGGLVLFGVGGNVNGGLLDAFKGGNGNANKAIEKRVEDVQKAVKARPNDAAAWARLAEAEYQLAGVSDGFKAQTGQFTGDALQKLVESERAWDQHIKLVGDKGRPNANTAAIMRNVFSPSGLNKPAKAVQAQEIVIDSKPKPGFGDYAQLAVLAYNAKQSRKGDLAKAKAIELAPKGQGQAIKQSIEQASQAKASAPPTSTTG